MKRYILNQSPKGLGATGYGGLKPFVDHLKYRLHLHRIVKGFGQKLWGYKLGALVLVLLCRPQLGAKSIVGLREKLLARFICRLFYIRWESKAARSHQKHRASVDVLYDLFGKLDSKQIRKAIRDFQRLVDLRPHGQSSQLPFSFSDPKTNFTPGGENCRKYRWSETGRWNTGSNLEDAHQGAETHLDHGRR